MQKIDKEGRKLYISETEVQKKRKRNEKQIKCVYDCKRRIYAFNEIQFM